MFKRALSLIVCFVMLISTLAGTGLTLSANEDAADIPAVQPTVAASKNEGVVTPDRATATYSGKCGDNLTWTLDTSTGVLNITGTGKMTDYSSSSSVPWYSNRSYIKTIKIGNSVTSIGDYAFYYCYFLKSVTIPNSVTSIGYRAFCDCTSLKSVTIGNSVTSIGNSAFYYCESLTSVTIPDSVTSIGNSAFCSCTSLTSVNIPNSVTSIGNSAFAYCYSLTSVNIPNSVTSIGNSAFAYCDSLTSVNIGNSVTSIGEYAFYSCDSLTSVTIGNSVTSIGDWAFSWCTSLTSVYYGGIKSDWDSIYIGNGNEELLNANITFAKRAMTGIAVSKLPAKNTYYVGDALNTSGLELKAIYDDNTEETITTGYTTSYTFTATGTSRVVVSYGGYTTDFTVTVKSPKITINEKDRFDLTAVTEPAGYTVTWESSDKTILDVSAGKLLYKDKAGKATITASFTYNGRKYSAHYNVEVGEVKDNVISVSVSSMPEKTTYYIGDIIDTTGLKLKLVYSDGSSSIVASGFEIIDPNVLSAGAKIIYVSYDGIKTYFTVTVKAPAVKFSESSKSVGVGSSFSLKATTDPANIYVSYSSSDNNIASVDRNGRVTTITWGEAVITASATYNGRVYTAECVVTVSGASDPVYDSPFTDVKDSHWFADSVLYCVQQGYVAGMTEDTFVPNGKLTRAQFLTILAKFDGVDLTRYERTDAGFTDVKTSHWFNNVVCWAVENEYTSGLSADKFGPNNNITRAQLARFFYVYSQKNGIKTTGRADLTSFSDAGKVTVWAKVPVEWAVSAGLISGVTKNGANYLDPNGTATRAQAAVMFKAFDAFAGR